jgi:hypothetical protein
MKSIFLFFFIILTSYHSFSQSVFDDEINFKFSGTNYLAEVKVDKEKHNINYVLRDRNGKILVSEILSFDILPLQRYISFYNSIGLLEDDSDMYFYDFLKKKKLLRGSTDKYSEGIGLGKYNPILNKNILKIVDENLIQIRMVELEVIPNSDQSWILLNEGTDLVNGKIKLLKKVKQGERSNVESVYHNYEFDVLKNELIRKL